MAVNTKAIKGRIKSVKNTKKITKAMEMVSAAKMRKAVQAALDTREYGNLARELMQHLSKIDEPNYELLKLRPVKNLLVVLISSNRGLCGSFNSNVFKRTAQILADKENLGRHRVENGEDILPEKDFEISVIGVGKKSASFAKKNNYNLVAVFDSLSEKRDFDEIVPIGRMIIEEYKKGSYDKVVVAYTDYISSLSQAAKVRQLLPISPKDLEKMMGIELGKNQEEKTVSLDEGVEDYPLENYLFEPSTEAIVEYVLPRLVEIQIFQAVLESAASEHSARMMAMRNASDAAGDMIDGLNLSFNKARQAAITQEIAEIAGGAAALSN